MELNNNPAPLESDPRDRKQFYFHATPLALTDRLMFTLAAALPPEMRGVYAEMPRGFG